MAELKDVGRNQSEQPLVGRDHELRVLAELLDATGGPARPLMLQVAGEPGIGKSRLLRELCKQADARGYLVLSGRAAEFEAEHPFGVFGDALDDQLMARDRADLGLLADGLATDLAVVLPAFEALAAGRPRELRDGRYRAYRAFRGLLSSLAVDVPVALVLDDVQWADPGSVELICHLLSRPPRGPVLLALGFRPARVSPQLDVALAAAVREQRACRLDLAPLSLDAACELLGPEVSGTMCDQLYRESGGNPFFLLQLARGNAFVDRRHAARAGVDSGVPEAVRAALAGELSALSARSLLLLQGAAVTGDPFETVPAAAAADIPEAEAGELIDELLRYQLVYPTGVVGQFAFRHPIVRSMVYELAGTGWRVHAHGRVAALLAASHAGAPAQAPHVERSARRGDRTAVALLVAAGVATAPRAPALAARWYAAALRLMPENADTEPEGIELRLAMAHALSASGQLEESRTALCEVLEGLPARDPGRVQVVAHCARVEHLLGRHRDARARLSLAHRMVEEGRSEEALLLELELAGGAAYENRYEEMDEWAELALEGATRLGHPTLEVVARGQVATARYFGGMPDGGAIELAAAGLDALDDAALAERLDIGLAVGWAEAVLERHEAALAHCQRVIDVSHATRQGATLLVTMTAQAWSLIRLGRLDDAEETLTAAVEAGRLAPNVFLSVAVGLSSVLATYRGQFEAAVRAGEESVRLARAADPGLILGVSGLFLATPLIEMGQARRARDAVLAARGGGGARAARPADTAAYEVLTRAELSLGRPRAAEVWARRAQAAAYGGHLGAEAAFAYRAMAAVALARGDARAAAELALDGAARADNAGAPVEAGRCRILRATALGRADRRAEAIDVLDRTVEELGRIGAHGYRAQAEKALRALGRRAEAGGSTAGAEVRRTDSGRSAASAADGGLTSLTERERQVARLVRRGYTNREIAAAIFVSEKSVERHLSRIFAKLGLSRRTELALQVAAEGDHGA